MKKIWLSGVFGRPVKAEPHEDFHFFFKGMERVHDHWAYLQTFQPKAIELGTHSWCKGGRFTVNHLHEIQNNDGPNFIGCRFVIDPIAQESPSKHVHDLVFYGNDRVGYAFQQIPKDQNEMPAFDLGHRTPIGMRLADAKRIFAHNLSLIGSSDLHDVIAGSPRRATPTDAQTIKPPAIAAA